MNGIQTNVVKALIDHEVNMRGGFQPETNHVPLEIIVDLDKVSFTITLSNDTEA